MVAGVCGALGGRFGVSRTLVRLLFLVFGIVGAGEVVYLILWILIPKRRD